MIISVWVICLIMTTTYTAVSAMDLVVIVHPENPVIRLSHKQVSDMFLGRRRAFPTGNSVLVLEAHRNSAIREIFFLRLNGMTLKRLNAYWARLQFSGNVHPPPEMENSRAVLEAVRQNQSAIGYVDAAILDNSVKPVLHLKK